jgi:autotransporter-associated beta strand protein
MTRLCDGNVAGGRAVLLELVRGVTSAAEVRIAKGARSMKRQTCESRVFGMLVVVTLAWGTPTSAATRTWDGVTDAEWTTTTNWSGGVFAGNAANGLVGGGVATDVMSRGASSGTTVGIDMAAVGAGGGVGLTLAALDLAAGTQSGFTIGNSSTTESGILQLDGGVTLGGTPNSYIRLPTTMAGNGTITNSVGSGTQPLGLRLGALNGVFNVGTNKTLTLAVSLSEASPGSGFIKTGGGTVVLNQPGTLVGGIVSINQGTVRVQTTGGVLGGASGPIIRLGSGSNACNFGLNNSITIANDFLIPVTTAQQTIQPSSANISPTISGTVTALGNVRFFHNQTGGTLRISGAANSVDTGAVVQFRTNTTGSIRDSAVWSGAGSLEYTGTGAGLLYVSGQKTYSGGATILTTTGGVVVSANSTGPAGSVTSGPFGTGILTLQGGASMRSGTGNAFSVGNPVAITGDVAFPTIADEKSLTLAGPVDLGGSTRTLGVDIGTTALTSALTLSGVVTNGGITKTGAGTLVLGGANTYSGPTIVSAGTLEITNPAAVVSSNVAVDTGATLAIASGTTMQAPSVIVDGGTLSGATVAVNNSIGIASLAINAGTISGSPAVSVGTGGALSLVQDARVTLAVGSLDVTETAGGGRVDVGAGALNVAAGGISAGDLRADIIAGRNGGTWDGVTGITSSASAGSGGTRAVGYVVNGDGSARVSFAAFGDVDLSGAVNVFDLVSINSSGTYGTGAAAVWSQGDFNYDGVTNVFDLVGINTAGAYGQGDYFPAAPTAGSISAVPEPSLIAGIGISFGGAWWFRRRRIARPMALPPASPN